MTVIHLNKFSTVFIYFSRVVVEVSVFLCDLDWMYLNELIWIRIHVQLPDKLIPVDPELVEISRSSHTLSIVQRHSNSAYQTKKTFNGGALKSFLWHMCTFIHTITVHGKRHEIVFVISTTHSRNQLFQLKANLIHLEVYFKLQLFL